MHVLELEPLLKPEVAYSFEPELKPVPVLVLEL